jgi:hypothetical protein
LRADPPGRVPPQREPRHAALTAAAALVLALAGIPDAAAQAERVVDLPTRPGATLRHLRLDPPAGTPAAAVILLAGGHGNLMIAPDGRMAWGSGNQLVRTRRAYARAGFVVAVPDTTDDLKEGTGVRAGLRWSAEQAEDLGALVRHLRTAAPKVHLVATSRAAISLANAAARLSGDSAPDALVVTSGVLVHVDDRQPSAERNVPGLARARQPVLLVHHRADGCRYTPAAALPRARALFADARKVDVRMFEGGDPGQGDPCEATSPHGFLGLDREVVALVADWLKALD